MDKAPKEKTKEKKCEYCHGKPIYECDEGHLVCAACGNDEEECSFCYPSYLHKIQSK